MKYEELQYERLGDANETYPASTLVIRKQFVVAAIDELKREHHKERHEYIEMVAQLKAKLVEQESENRKLKRALYKSCANWAKFEERINCMDAYEASEYLPSTEDNFRKKAERWSEMERKCLKKAKEFV